MLWTREDTHLHHHVARLEAFGFADPIGETEKQRTNLLQSNNVGRLGAPSSLAGQTYRGIAVGFVASLAQALPRRRYASDAGEDSLDIELVVTELLATTAT